MKVEKDSRRFESVIDAIHYCEGHGLRDFTITSNNGEVLLTVWLVKDTDSCLNKAAEKP